MQSEQFDAMVQTLGLTARFVARVAVVDRRLAEDVLTQELPWLVWLPVEARSECVRELLDHLRAGAVTGLLLPFSRALREWQSTAEIYSEPALLHRLQGPFDTASALALDRPGDVD